MKVALKILKSLTTYVLLAIGFNSNNLFIVTLSAFVLGCDFTEFMNSFPEKYELRKHGQA